MRRTFFNDIGMGILPATLPFFIALYGMSYADVSGLIFAASFLSSIIQPISGWIADKVSKAWIMSIGIFLSGVAMGSIGLFKNYWLIFIAVTISGIVAMPSFIQKLLVWLINSLTACIKVQL